MKKLSLFCFLLFTGLLVNAQDAAKLQNYTGVYTMDGGPIDKVTVMVRDGKLYGASSQGEATLTPKSDADTYTIEGYDGTVKFNRDGGVVKSMVMNIQGQEMKGMRKMPAADDFIGKYMFENAPFKEMMVTAEDGIVHVEVADIGKGPLDVTSNLDEYYEPNYSSKITFKRNDKGEVDRVMLISADAQMEGKKEMAASIDNYTGNFEFPDAPFSQLIVTNKNGKLHGNAVGQGEAEMIATDEKDKFTISGYDGTATYIRGGDGKINGVELNIQGSLMRGTKKM